MSRLLQSLAGILALASCIERAPGGSVSKRRDFDYSSGAVRRVLGASTPRNPSHAVFGGAIELIGWDLEPPRVPPGSSATLTFYWRCLQELDGDWQVFIHLDGRDGQERIHGDHWPAGGDYHTDVWRRGDVVKDSVRISIPGRYTGDFVDAWIGWYQGDERLPISNSGDVRNDGQNRLLGMSLPLR